MGKMAQDARQGDPRDRPFPAIARDHRRQWADCLYVYPVISRRAKGLSVGVNLNPDKRCNFACLYCQIDRRVRRDFHEVDVAVLRHELERVLAQVASGRLWAEPRFAETPPAFRRINDIAFSGDGEPTCLPAFDQAVAAAAEAKDALRPADVKIVVITNASCLDSPQVARALPILDAHHGEVWAKLDAGSEAFFRQVNRPRPGLTLDKIVGDIAAVAAGREVVIQTLLFRLEGAAPPPEEIDAYCVRLRQVLDAGGHIRLVQVHTIARRPGDPRAAGLRNDELDAIADKVRAAVRDVPVETYYGTTAAADQRR